MQLQQQIATNLKLRFQDDVLELVPKEYVPLPNRRLLRGQIQVQSALLRHHFLLNSLLCRKCRLRATPNEPTLDHMNHHRILDCPIWQ